MNRPVPLRAVALAAMLAAGCAVDLQHDLGEQDANDIYVLLSKNGIAARKLRDESGNEPTYRISVPKQDAAQAMQLLSEHSLPRPMSEGLGIFVKNKGMVPTETEERAMFLEALSGEVTNALNRIDGVLEARAIVMIPQTTDLTQEDKKPMPSASVLVKYRPTPEGRAPLNEEQIRAFVAGAVPELRKEVVTVLLTEAQSPGADVSPEQRMQDVLGIRMTAGSAAQFKIIMGVTGLVVLAMAIITALTFLRASGVNVPSFGRSRSRGAGPG